MTVFRYIQLPITQLRHYPITQSPMNELILVVDDEPKIVKLARDYLEKGGFRVVSAGDGSTAVTIARHDKPDLIVLDLNLPGMDGLELCRTIRRESDVPIIMLTARSEGILLDPVYTGRAMAGLIDMIRTGEIGRQDKVLFWHTGGTPALFAYSEELGHSQKTA